MQTSLAGLLNKTPTEVIHTGMYFSDYHYKYL